MLRPLFLSLYVLWSALLLSNVAPVQAQTAATLVPPIRLGVSADTSLVSGQPAVLRASGEQAPSALAFDGVDDLVRIPAGASPTQSAPVLDITNTFTVEAWVWPTAPHEIDPQSRSGTAGTSGQRYLIFPTPGWLWGDGSNQAGMGLSVGTRAVTKLVYTI